MARLMTEINGRCRPTASWSPTAASPRIGAGFCSTPRRPGRAFVPDRGFASIGYGLPGAMGAAMAAPGRPVFSLTGDGGFNMMLGELETARRLGLTFTRHRRQQRRLGLRQGAPAPGLRSRLLPRFGSGGDRLRRRRQALGCTGIRVEDPAKLAGALRTALATRGRPCVDVVVTRDPASMLPGVDNRAVVIKKGDRIA